MAGKAQAQIEEVTQAFRPRGAIGQAGVPGQSFAYRRAHKPGDRIPPPYLPAGAAAVIGAVACRARTTWLPTA